MNKYAARNARRAQVLAGIDKARQDRAELERRAAAGDDEAKAEIARQDAALFARMGD